MGISEHTFLSRLLPLAMILDFWNVLEQKHVREQTYQIYPEQNCQGNEDHIKAKHLKNLDKFDITLTLTRDFI